MSQLKKQLSKLLPRFSQEANKIQDPEARSRWMKIKKITESPKSLAQACRFFGMSEDAYQKWGQRLLKYPKGEALLSKSRRPHRSPNKTKPRLEKKVLKVRRVEPYLGPERISDTLKEIYSVHVPAGTVYNILLRAKVVGKKHSERLTKKHLKRYRRPWPGYLQMDFKYVPYLIGGQQYYQLSCVDHHSSWRLIRCYKNKNISAVKEFLAELLEQCPFVVLEIQTDNDSAFTDKFTSTIGVTGMHDLDQWCMANDVVHKLIPPGVKELNGKVENTHKQDDREFFAMNHFKTYESLATSSKGYNDRWNNLRATRALGGRTPYQAIGDAYVRALALLLSVRNERNSAVYSLDPQGNAIAPIPKPKKVQPRKNRTRKSTYLEKYLAYQEWADKKKLLALITYPTMSQNFSV